MSSKSTIISLPCCHIYEDCIGANGGDTLVVSVDYGSVREGRDDNDFIEVEAESEFANLMRYLLQGKSSEELLAASKGETYYGAKQSKRIFSITGMSPVDVLTKKELSEIFDDVFGKDNSI